MKKTLFPFVVLAILAITCLAACKSEQKCAAYQDSGTNSKQMIKQFHSRG